MRRSVALATADFDRVLHGVSAVFQELLRLQVVENVQCLLSLFSVQLSIFPAGVCMLVSRG